jgi:predicted transcriptional regulator
MADLAHNPPNGETKAPNSRRRSVLDLAPLELDCMNTLWPLGAATVREIRERLAQRRPRAYTTIMTIMDRLARKGVVERHKSGRAYVYRARVTAEEARSQALAQLIDNFFAGSKEELLVQLQLLAVLEAESSQTGGAALAPKAMAASADYTK